MRREKQIRLECPECGSTSVWIDSEGFGCLDCGYEDEKTRLERRPKQARELRALTWAR